MAEEICGRENETEGLTPFYFPRANQESAAAAAAIAPEAEAAEPGDGSPRPLS